MATNLAFAMPLPMDTRDKDAEAQELRKLRESFGLTQEQLAQRLGVTMGTYWRWESGRVICPLTAIELMRCWAREEAQAKRSVKRTGRK
jgi:DNA-binding transcriptional regulator YiaG